MQLTCAEYGILPFGGGNIQLSGEKLRTQGSKRVASLRANREEQISVLFVITFSAGS